MLEDPFVSESVLSTWFKGADTSSYIYVCMCMDISTPFNLEGNPRDQIPSFP